MLIPRQDPERRAVPPSSHLLIRNPHEALPLSLALDNSGSTFANGAAEEIQAGLKKFAHEFSTDRDLMNRVEISVAWLPDRVPFVTPFTLARDFVPPEMPYSFGSPIFTQYCYMVGLAHERAQALGQQEDRDAQRAWIFFFSDFWPTDLQYRADAQKAKAFAVANEIEIFIFGCGHDIKREVAEELATAKHPPLRFTSTTSFRDFFPWLKKSYSIRSRSMPGDIIKLPPTDGFAERL